MKYHEFNWKGVDSGTKGIIVEKQAQYIRPQERIERIEIPGRSGTLTYKRVRPVYDVVLYAPQCYVRPDVRPETIGDYLSGSGKIIFGSMPDRIFEAHLINQIPFASGSEKYGYKLFTPIFECQPYAFEISGQNTQELTQNGIHLDNKGNTDALPWLQVYGSGNIGIEIGSTSLQLKDINDGVTIDSEAMTVMDLAEEHFAFSNFEGEYPVLKTGNCRIAWTGDVQKIVIKPRWRFL